MSQHEPVLEKYLTVGDYETPGWGPSYVPIHGNQLEKIAGEVYTPASLLKVIQDLKPRPEGRYVLLHALGAYEYWGANRNGDGFPEWSLKSLAPPQEVRSVLDGPVRKACPNFTTPPPSMYGCDTFVKYAHVYRGHANKDPLKACGDVIAAAYNDRMHRVELIVFVYSQRAPDIIDRIDRGAPVAWSMGARLPFDVCSICGNIARTRAHYCRHLAQELGTVYPDGRKVFSYNYFPRFFDISEVGVPADRSAWTLAKVAGLGTGAIPPRRLVVKSASMEKRPDVGGSESLGKAPINPKLLNFIAAAVNRDYDDSVELPDAQLMAMKRHGLAKSLAAAALMGILLKPREVEKLAADAAQLPDELEFASVDRTLVASLEPYLGARSLFEPFISKRAARRLGKPERPLSKTSSHSPVFAKYAQLLRSMDMEKWAQVVTTNPAVRLSLDPDAVLNALSGSQGSFPPWLPFAVGSANLC